MIFGSLIFITALCISAVAIYYSVAGLVAIFAAAALPIMIMGGVLEVGKLVTAVWLHKYWKQATWWLKGYLTTAVVVLMFITSMGIFGFLSKAHIEQTSASVENVAQVENIDKQIAQLNAVISRAEDTVNKTETSGTGADQNIQAQIDKEQERIDTAYNRVKPAIEQTNAQLKQDSELYLNQIKAIDDQLEKLNSMSSIDTSDKNAVKLLQQLVGSRPDGAYGSGTARAVKAYKEDLETKKQSLFAQIEQLKSTAKDEVKRLRVRAETEIDDSNTLIERLRKQLGTDTGIDIDAIIDEQNNRIKLANIELDKLTEQKFAIEAEYRKLEAEVGPIKYIAEFIYGGEADKNLLEEAVRWVIITIIFVFDPLAVLLLIASQYTFEWRKQERDNGNNTPPTEPSPTDPYTNKEWDEAHRDNYEYDRAKKISENKPPEIKNETRRQDPKEEQQDAEELREWQEEQSVPPETGDDTVVAEEEIQEGPVEDVTAEKEGSGNNTESSDGDGLTPGTYTGDPQPVPMEQEVDNEQVQEGQELEKWNDWVEAANKEAEQESKTYKIIPELQEQLDTPTGPVDEDGDGIDDITGKPITNTLAQKMSFSTPVQDQDVKKKNYITKVQNEQVRKETQDPNSQK